jgi:SAM-dependent methyltransferase
MKNRNVLINPNVENIDVSNIDENYLILIRKNVDDFIENLISKYIGEKSLILEIGSQNYNYKDKINNCTIHTLDLYDKYNPTFVGDITKKNNFICDETYDYIICTEVLEHTENPFNAIIEMSRILKKNGIIFCTVPFNFRIHGPLPDSWRISEWGLKILFKEFKILFFDALEDNERNLFPLHYRIIVQKI